jgi:hypothetical protein
MRRMMRKLLLPAAFVLAGAPMAMAGPIESACQNSGRTAADPALCACIQKVADLMLSSADQRQAARFFSSPERAQAVRQSGRDADAAFWLRYREFGTQAEALCTR